MSVHATVIAATVTLAEIVSDVRVTGQPDAAHKALTTAAWPAIRSAYTAHVGGRCPRKADALTALGAVVESYAAQAVNPTRSGSQVRAAVGLTAAPQRPARRWEPGGARTPAQERLDDIAGTLATLGEDGTPVGWDDVATLTGWGSTRQRTASAWTLGGNGAQPAYWNGLFVACLRAGVAVETDGKGDGFALILTRLSDEDAQARREAYAANLLAWAKRLGADKLAKVSRAADISADEVAAGTVAA